MITAIEKKEPDSLRLVRSGKKDLPSEVLAWGRKKSGLKPL